MASFSISWRCCACLPVVAALMLPARVAAAVDGLRILNWPTYLQPELVQAFEREHGAKVSLIEFHSDDERTEMISASEAHGFDLLLVNEVSLTSYARRGWLGSFSPSEVPNARHIDPQWQRAAPASSGHCLAYFWGGIGIAYRSDLVERAPTRWTDLLSPAAAWKGKIMMTNDGSEMLDVALRALGSRLADADMASLQAAESLLLTQRDSVFKYAYPDLNRAAHIVTGKVVVALTFAGGVAALQAFEPAIEFVYPEEGTELWVDFWCLSANAANRPLVLDFLDFINDPARAAANARAMSYATTNLSSLALLSAAERADPLMFPPAAVVARSNVPTELPVRLRKRVQEIRTRILR